MAAVQLSFSLRTSPNCKTVHLLGSWDGYKGQLPLSNDSSKKGAWKGTFRFQGATLKQGQRYWYYYIIDGYHVSHDPAKSSTTEPTTGRQLNILDVPADKNAAVKVSSRAPATTRQERRTSASNVPKGRALSPSKIVSPRPVNPIATRHITSGQCMNALTDKFSRANLHSAFSSDEEDSGSDIESDCASDVPSLSSSTSGRSYSSSSSTSSSPSPGSVSSTSSCCTCDRYGITRKGDRVRLDCGGSRCGGSDLDSCSSESEDEYYRAQTTRRQGVVIRGSSR